MSPQPQNHFELFSLPVRFALDRQFLDRRYLELARQTHPDFARNDPDAQLAALQLSSAVNEAYAVLNDDLRRAEYILSLRGVKLADVQPSGEVMQRIFELREAVDEAVADPQRAAKAKAEASAWLDQIMAWVASKLDAETGVAGVAPEIAAARYLKKIVGQ